jgi:hypothetical protein
MVSTDTGELCSGTGKPPEIPQEIWDYWFSNAMRAECTFDPVGCVGAGLAALKAVQFARSLRANNWEGTQNGTSNDAANAIQHASWNALMEASGTTDAKKWGDLREWPYREGDAMPEAYQMDFFNNRIGRGIGYTHRLGGMIINHEKILQDVIDAYYDYRMYCMDETQYCFPR